LVKRIEEHAYPELYFVQPLRDRSLFRRKHVFEAERCEIEERGEEMEGKPPVAQTSQKAKAGFVRRHFDGIQYLWRTRETHYVMKLIVILFASVIATYSVLILLTAAMGESNLLMVTALYIEPFFIALFLLVLIEIAGLYWSDRKGLHGTSKPGASAGTRSGGYWPLTGLKGKKSIVVIALFGSLVFYSYAISLSFLEQYMNFCVLYVFPLFFLLFVAGFLAARESMKKSKNRYIGTVKRRRYLVFALFPIPWILFSFLYFGVPGLGLLAHFDGSLALSNLFLATLFLYGFLCVAGLFAVQEKKWWAGYTVCQVSASLTFFFVAILPFLVDAMVSLLGAIISLVVLGVLFVQGVLDECGDDLREYHKLSGRKPQATGTQSLGDATRGTQKDSDVRSAYPNLILRLTLMVVTFFALILTLAPPFVALGMEKGIEMVEIMLELDFLFETLGIGIAIMISTFAIWFRKLEKN
jgi:hypothetical protein